MAELSGSKCNLTDYAASAAARFRRRDRLGSTPVEEIDQQR